LNKVPNAAILARTELDESGALFSLERNRQ